MKTRLHGLLRHMRWADERSVGPLRGLETPPAGGVRIFAHLATAERIHLEPIRGEDPFALDDWPDLELDEAESTADAVVRSWRAFVGDADPDLLERPAGYPNNSGTYYETAPVQTFTHRVLHGKHHRGRIARIVPGSARRTSRWPPGPTCRRSPTHWRAAACSPASSSLPEARSKPAGVGGLSPEEAGPPPSPHHWAACDCCDSKRLESRLRDTGPEL